MVSLDNISNKDIVVFGVGLDAVRCTYLLKDVEIRYYLNNNLKVQEFLGKEVFEPGETNTKNVYILVAVRKETYTAISKQLQELGLVEFEDYIYYDWLYKRIALLHGNCHMAIVEQYLSLSREFSENYSIYPNPLICENVTHKIEDKVLACLDLWIHEDIQRNNKFGYEMSDEYMRKKVSKNAIEITIPNLFGLGKGFFPQTSNNILNKAISNGQDLNGMFPHGDIVIDECIKRGMSVDEIIAYVKSDSIFSKEAILQNFSEYMEKIRKREEAWDIKIYDYIVSNYKKTKLFYDVGHPTNIIMKKISNEILAMLGMELCDREIDTQMDIHETPVYPAVKKCLNLEWTEGYIRESNLAKKASVRMDLDEYVRLYVWWCYGILE